MTQPERSRVVVRIQTRGLASNSAALCAGCSFALLADASMIELATIEATRPRSGHITFAVGMDAIAEKDHE